MDTFICDMTSDLPSIVLDASNKLFEIKGASFPEDAREFYEPVFDWLYSFNKRPFNDLQVVFHLTYYNTSTSKVFNNILGILENVFDKGYEMNVLWKYDIDDEDMYEAGLGYADRISMPFNLVGV